MGSFPQRLDRRGWLCSGILGSKESLYLYSNDGIYYLLQIDPILMWLSAGMFFLEGFLVASSILLVEDQGGVGPGPQVVDAKVVRMVELG